MSERDQRQRFLIESCGVRGELVRLDASLRAATERTDYPPQVDELLSQAFVAANLLTGTLKFDGRLTLQVTGEGDVHLLVVQVTSGGSYRGLARWRAVPAPDATLDAVFGRDARMAITIEADERAEPYQGIVLLEGATLAEAIGRYFRDSEQLATTLQLCVHDGVAAGLLLQRLPDIAGAHAFEEGSGDENWQRATALAGTVEPQELALLGAETLLHRLFHEERVRLFDAEPLRFACACSRERTDGMLLGLGREEIDDIVAERGDVEIVCEFCDATYRYDLVDVEALFVAGDSRGTPLSVDPAGDDSVDRGDDEGESSASATRH